MSAYLGSNLEYSMDIKQDIIDDNKTQQLTWHKHVYHKKTRLKLESIGVIYLN